MAISEPQPLRSKADVIGSGAAPSFAGSLPQWHEQAACRDADVNFIIETTGGRETASSVVKAFEVCAGCPVRQPCLRSAFDAPFTVMGIWGGTTMTERRVVLHRTAPSGPLLDGEWRTAPGWHRQADEAVELLETTFAERTEGWKARAELEKASRG